MKPIVQVQKYGGASLSTAAKIQAVAGRIKRAYDGGKSIVVIVSAREGVTDNLIRQAEALNPNAKGYQLDQLLIVGELEMIALVEIALEFLGVPAVSRTGAQVGILTNNNHTDAEIEEITLGDIPQRLAERKVVIVAGFQGITKEGRVTTLGRGGSDLTAIALAIALKADSCQFYKDVDGIYTEDPNINPNATKLEHISYNELLEMALSGSQIMQVPAIQLAKEYQMPFEVRSSFSDAPGTTVSGISAVLQAQFLTECSRLAISPSSHYIIVSIDAQELYYYEGNVLEKTYTISTSEKVPSCEQNSYGTPWGMHKIAEKFGEEVELGTVLKERKPIGKKYWEYQTSAQDERLVTSRILWLQGLESGLNLGDGIDSYSRYIYIHGTNCEHRIGSPATLGCITLKNEDVIKLYNKTSCESLVWIHKIT